MDYNILKIDKELYGFAKDHVKKHYRKYKNTDDFIKKAMVSRIYLDKEEDGRKRTV